MTILLSEEQILHMPAGYELNKLIAEEVMGWRLEKNLGDAGGSFWIGHGGSFGDMPERNLPDFSGENAPALSVAERFDYFIVGRGWGGRDDYGCHLLDHSSGMNAIARA